MLLRRITENVKEQNWFAVAIDFVIVVAGILIAFQITEWNEARANRVLEHDYLERLYADMERTLDPSPGDTEWDQARKVQQSLILDALRSGTLPEESREAFNTGLAFFGFVGGFDIHWATVDEMRSTGTMNLIRDVSLRSKILSIDADLKRRQAIADNFMAAIYAHRQQLGDRFGVIKYSGEREAVNLDYDFAALAADPKVFNILSQIDFLARFRLDLNRATLADVSELKDELGQRLELERDQMP